MKIVKNASGKTCLKISRKDIETIANAFGWGKATVPQKEKGLETEEIADAWQSSEEDIKVDQNGVAWCNNKQIANADKDGNPNFFAIKRWMDQNKYFPNVWLINERGNVELVSLGWNGKPTYHGGLV